MSFKVRFSLRRSVARGVSLLRARARGDTFETLIANVIIAGATVLAGVVAARVLGPTGRGELGAIRSWSALFAGLAMFGMQDAIIYHGARSRENVGRYALTAATFILAVGTPFMFAAWFAMPWLFREQGPAVVTGARWYLLTWAIFAVGGIPVFIVRALGRFRTWNILRVGPAVLWLTLLTTLALAGEATALRVAEAYVAVLAVYALAVLPVASRYVRANAKPTLAVCREMLRFAVPAELAALPDMIGQRLDQLLIASLLPAADLGYYAVALGWAGGPMLASSAITALVFPTVAGLKTHAEQRAYVRRAAIRVTVLSGLIGSVFALAAPFAVPLLFGRAFRPAVALTEVLLLAMVLQSLGDVLQAALNGVGRPSAVFRARLVGLLVAVPLLWLALPRFGVMGAAAVTVGAQLVVVGTLARAWRLAEPEQIKAA